MKQLRDEFVLFMSDIEKRAEMLGLSLLNYPIDQVCYRITTIEDYRDYKKLFIGLSVLYTEKFFHERYFHLFVLQQPFIYKNAEIYFLEFSQPGGSDEYEKGFQHLELLTPQTYKDIFSREVLENLLFRSKDGEEYLKWQDKIALKFTPKPVVIKSFTEDNPKIIVNR